MPATSTLLDQAPNAIERKLFAMKGFHHPQGSQQAFLTGLAGLDHGIGHFMLFEVDLVARAPVPPILKSLQTSSAASDRKTAPQPSSRQAG